MPHRPRPVQAVLAVLALTLTLAAPAAVTAAPSATGVPTAAGGLWLAGDLHAHTTYSHDSYGGPDDDNTGPEEAYTAGWRVGEQFANAAARGLDFLAITDHNDVRSQADPGFGTHGVIPVPAYENSLDGHAQMLGATTVLDAGDRSAAAVTAMADALRDQGGVLQVNHPGGSDPADPESLDWGYGYDVVPDSVEVWNISRLYQPPFPSGSSNDVAVAYWEGWLDRGHLPAATAGSDNHYVATAGAQGVGQPTTWVYAADRSTEAVLAAIRGGRTTISFQPPNLGGPRIFLEADRDGDGTHEAMVGDTVAPGTPARVRLEGAPGATLAIHFGGGPETITVPVTTASLTHGFTIPPEATWVRAEAGIEDAAEQRAELCDPLVGTQTTYCRDDLAVVAMTSAVGVASRPLPPGTEVVVDGSTATIRNDVVERTFTLAPFGTRSMTDLRTGFQTGASDDFTLRSPALGTLTGADFSVADHAVFPTTTGGLALRLELVHATLPGTITRTYTVHPGIAVVAVDTEVAVPGAYEAYTLDAVGVTDGVATAHHFNAGYDWRGSDTPDWEPAANPFGGHHAGDHRVTTTAPTLDVTAQWLSVDTAGATVFQVLQRVNYDSSHMAYDGTTARAHVDLADDLAYLGPFEGEAHLDNPAPATVRVREVLPGESLALERVVTGLALDADDAAWQHLRFLRDGAWAGWQPTVTFNSNGVDDNRISTGAKDDMDLAETQRQAAIARRLGVETFILDDGWQAASGDWCPDSADCPEPRGLYPDRFPDTTFGAVREAIAPMDLGLWMSPMQFNPASDTYGEHPDWACSPLGDALALYNTVEPDSSSNEAGLGTWNAGNADLISHIEQRIARAIEVYGSTYFKFDFLAWVDCVGVTDTATAYDYREAFVAMVDRLIAAHPHVTFQIDETNDYRLFPFESAARGPSWYANGNPTPDEALHNLWILSPYVPAQTIGQSALGRHESHPVDTLMPIALTSHITFFNDLTSYSDATVEEARRWVDLYTVERDRFTGVVYPLLDDPIGGQTWTGLQSWDADARAGAVLLFRQQDPAATTTVALRGIRGDGTWVLRDALTGEVVMTATGEELRSGIPVTLAEPGTAAVWLVDPAV